MKVTADKKAPPERARLNMQTAEMRRPVNAQKTGAFLFLPHRCGG